ncbi:TPA: hypothetical protein I8050_001011 [Legionella pneumophila]|uniref:hypothetical protein n=1 Tax=Legionella pneumophila TaxID=446 RepID=UPI000493F8C3|nr:hypothetical protein [Legionella pneumophila]HAT2150953.1 hypothetical protein [Legionella pneumophila]
MEKKINTTKISIILMDNAFEFAKRAAQDIISKDFKFAIINFCSSIEQIIKAKLIQNDWKCIVSNESSTSIDDFKNGDFKSIDISTALSKLDKPDNPKGYSKTIKRLFIERNKVIHFYNPKLHDEDEEELIANLIYQAWFKTHKFLSANRDKLYFQPDFFLIHRELTVVKSYLEEVYSKTLVEVREEEKKGKKILSCCTCGLEAMTADATDDLIKIGHCLICEHHIPFIEVRCTCGMLNYLFELTEYYCVNMECNEKINCLMVDIKGALSPISNEFEYGEEYADCNLCDSCDSVGMIGDYYICSNCFEMSAEINQCECCGKLSTNLSSESCIDGCPSCGGIMSQFSEKD